MPIYEYRCENGHTFEVVQRMSDEPITECQVCGAPVQRVFHPVAVHFKGSGFYNTDYGKQKRGVAAGSDGDGSGGDGSDAKPKKDDAPKKKAETPAPSKAASASD